MKNPIRRNRNIGTAKQGYSQDNKMVIPWVSKAMKFFHERLENYTKDARTINGNRFEIIIEQTREDSEHACSVDDIAEILRHVNPKDYGKLNLIIFRQPKRKEELLSPVWGRLIYSYEFEGTFRPAIILEATVKNLSLKWTKKLNPENARELKRLEKDGYDISLNKRNYILKCSSKSIRNTQLYRTLPHEIGHYKHYLEFVGELDKNASEKEKKSHQNRTDAYHNLETSIKENYAHRFADELKSMLEKCGAIPFEKIQLEKESFGEED